MVATVLRILLGLTLVLALACGSAAPATPTTASAPATEPTAAPAESEPSQPTATPQAAAAPAEVEVNPGKVTQMIGSFGNERFDTTFTSAAGRDYLTQIHATLISSEIRDGRKVMAPGIATEWQISSDGLTWTFTIRKGVKYHNGTEVTAADALWSLQHTIGPQAGEYALSPASKSWSSIMDRIEQIGPDQVSVTTKIADAGFADAMSDVLGSTTSAVLPKRATLHDVQEEEAYDRNPIGAGHMKLVNHVPAEVMTFERFADYYQQPKYGFPIDKRVNFTLMDLRLVPEESTRVAALRAGEADIAPVSLGARKQVEAGGGRLVFAQEGMYFYIRLMGCWQPQFPCHDQRVRQALNYAIDKELIRDTLYGPEVMQVKGWFMVTPSSIGYSPELDPFPYDPDKARQLLADAGYPGGKGFGKLIINTYVSASVPLLPESAQLGAEFWKRELGLDVEVRIGDEAALKEVTQLTEDLYGQIFWRDNETKVNGSGTLRHSYGRPDIKIRAHNDPELFDQVQKALGVLDPVEQEKDWNSVYLQLRDEAWDISLGYINIPWGVGPRILTWQPDPISSWASGLYTITLK
ncbi:MAG TPA: ABC transporter substrate-binding protein [Dehalococcoidia bacterium]|nr:ABC transporter substrate-binding protein [Dehalococcoidia bacterium]